MKKQIEEDKPNLKHDTLEYAASTEGEDILDMDSQNKEEVEQEDITADELNILEEDDMEEQANALNTVETDRQADNDIHFNDTDPGKNDEPFSSEDTKIHQRN